MCERFSDNNVLRTASRLKPGDILGELKYLIQESSEIEPNLAKKLSRVLGWIAKKKLGLLTKKKQVLTFLTELVIDSQLYLRLIQANPNDKERVLDRMSSVEVYWYESLFPKWFNEPHDPKYDIWTQKLMGERFTQNDEEMLSCIARTIKSSGGYFIWRYILDLSMANDLLVNGSQNNPFCIQITTMSEENIIKNSKKENWEVNCRKWEIHRGAFVILNPNNLCRKVTTIAQDIIRMSDTSPNNSFVTYKN